MRDRYGLMRMALAAALMLGACGSVNRLQDCTFDDHTAFVVVTAPSVPFISLRTNAASIGPGRPPIRVDDKMPTVDLSVLMPTKRKHVRARIDSAAQYLDIEAQMARQTLVSTAHDLGYRPAEAQETADYLLAIDVRDYGFFMNRHVFTDFWMSAEMRLIDQRAGRRIWERKVQEVVPAADALAGLHVALGYRDYDRVATLAGLSVEEMTVVLKHVAGITTVQLTTALRDDYLASR